MPLFQEIPISLRRMQITILSQIFSGKKKSIMTKFNLYLFNFDTNCRKLWFPYLLDSYEGSLISIGRNWKWSREKRWNREKKRESIFHNFVYNCVWCKHTLFEFVYVIWTILISEKILRKLQKLKERTRLYYLMINACRFIVWFFNIQQWYF